jgi:hypothetical protein
MMIFSASAPASPLSIAAAPDASAERSALAESNRATCQTGNQPPSLETL